MAVDANSTTTGYSAFFHSETPEALKRTRHLKRLLNGFKAANSRFLINFEEFSHLIVLEIKT